MNQLEHALVPNKLGRHAPIGSFFNNLCFKSFVCGYYHDKIFNAPESIGGR